MFSHSCDYCLLFVTIVSVCSCMVLAGGVQLLLPSLGFALTERIAHFLGPRCTVCDQALGICFRDADLQWQFMCLHCAVLCIGDDDQSMIVSNEALQPFRYKPWNVPAVSSSYSLLVAGGSATPSD